MADIVAESKFVLTSADANEKRSVSIQILKPITDADGIDYTCQLKLTNLIIWNRSEFGFHGIDSMQALQLAIEFKDKLLEKIGESYSVELSEN